MNYQQLKSAIAATIKQNGRGEITGKILQAQLFGIINSLGSGFQFAGKAMPSWNPGSPDEKVFYLAEPGNYPHYGNFTVPENMVGILMFDGAWMASLLPVGNITTIVDNLISGGRDKALSAEMGKELAERLSEILTEEQSLIISTNGSGTLSVTKIGNAPANEMEYSLDDETWEVGTIPFQVPFTDKIYLRGNNNAYASSENDYTKIDVLDAGASVQQDFSVAGNIMSLVYGANVYGRSDLKTDFSLSGLFRASKVVDVSGLLLPATALTASCYANMFNGCASLIAAPVLPATVLAPFCYQNMFRDCTSLTAAPVLPATVLAERCYQSMFYGCTSLTAAPALPAMVLAERCYQSMFYGCTSLTAAPVLPATVLATGCYQSMFYGCTSLSAVPALPATVLVERCYAGMFYGCTSLTAAPVLPATVLAERCYTNMFHECTSLTAAPALPAMVLAERCYFSMFYGCTSLTAAPVLPATVLATNCYYSMFRSCTSLASVVCLAEDISATDAMTEWLRGVSATGTFTKRAGVAWPFSTSGIPGPWTVKETGISWKLKDNVPQCVAVPNNYVTSPDAEYPAMEVKGLLVEELLKACFVTFFDNITDVDSNQDWKPVISSPPSGGSAMVFKDWATSVVRIWGSVGWQLYNGQIILQTRDMVALVKIATNRYALVRYPTA